MTRNTPRGIFYKGRDLHFPDISDPPGDYGNFLVDVFKERGAISKRCTVDTSSHMEYTLKISSHFL